MMRIDLILGGLRIVSDKKWRVEMGVLYWPVVLVDLCLGR